MAAACGEDLSLLGDDGGPGFQGGGNGTGGSDAGVPMEPPPEEELEEDFQAPAAVGRFLWAANPVSNRVALIDATNLKVQAFDAGFAPTYLAGLPRVQNSRSGALVLNALSQDATVFFLPSGSAPVSRDTVEVHTVPVHPRANAWRIDPRSRFAIAWTDARAVEAADPTDVFQDITVIDLAPKEPRATRLSVGYRPSQVFVNASGERAFVVSQLGITVVHLTAENGPRVERDLFLPEHTGGTERDVSFTPDGALAFVRLERSSDVLIVNLETDARTTVSLPVPVTDLDVSADGSRAVAVMRRPVVDEPDGAAGAAGAPPSEPEPSRVAVLPVATIVGDPDGYELVELDELLGNAVVSADGKHALLFTNGVPHPILTILDLDDLSHRDLDLLAPVRAVFLTDDGSYAVALLSPPAGSVRKGAFSLVPIREELPVKLQGTDAPARFVSLTSDPPRALITTRDPEGGPHATYLARFPDLRVDSTLLPSMPLASGIVLDARKGFVAQAHPEGRVTFIDLEDGTPQLLTGFELGGKVVE